MEPIRLQKFFTDCGILSRRAAEAAIRAGEVRVNGAIATIGQKIDPERDAVEYRGAPLVWRAAPERHYILLNKPRGFVTTLSDEKARRTVRDLVASLGHRVYPVGRLDMDSDGLLLLTDDGALTERLTHPRHEIPKYYTVTVKGAVSDGQLAALNAPFVLDGYQTRAAKVAHMGKEGNDSLLSFELYEGRNRQIRRMCEQTGLRILRLTRTAIGRIALGDLPVGQYRALTEDEISYLKGETL
ncbi:MAG: rRNA pseudouridine synthase [Clostridia bacterium]|nr:rRNA pseudouridine synthase [Clostridia bacterium]